MKALYLPDVPVNMEELKSREPESFTIMGAWVYCWQVFEVLLRCSSYDRLLLPDPSEWKHDTFLDTKLYADTRDRITFVAKRELPQLSQFETVIFQTRPELHLGARIRRLSRCNIPVTGIIHSLNNTSHLLSTARLLTSSLKHYDALICSSHAGRKVVVNFLDTVRSRLEPAGIRQIDAPFCMPVIPLGIYADVFNDISGAGLRSSLGINDSTVLLYFGRLSKAKKADLKPVLIAFSQLLLSGYRASLILAGDDPFLTETTALKEAAQRLGCISRVRIVPNPSSEMKLSLFGAADIFVSPSDNLQETFGISLIEAMAAGLPVIAADWNGYREIVIENETGYLVPTSMPVYPPDFDILREAISATDLLSATTAVDLPVLYERFRGLVENRERRLEMGLAAKRRAQRLYDWTAIIPQYESLWDELRNRARDVTSTRITPMIDLDDYDYRDIFGHFPSSQITADTIVAVAERGRACTEDRTVLSTYCGGDEIRAGATIVFGLEDMHSMLCRIAKLGKVRIRNLAEQNSTGSLTLTMMIACRLLKYGLLASNGDARG